jgi:two-component system, OmpR family, sensor kinase
VRDAGPGIAPEEQDRVFSRFVRAKGNRSREGAGLGLSIVRAIAEAHGGSVQLRSRPGAGALFTLVLPSRTEQEDAVDVADEGQPDRTEHEVVGA